MKRIGLIAIAAVAIVVMCAYCPIDRETSIAPSGGFMIQ